MAVKISRRRFGFAGSVVKVDTKSIQKALKENAEVLVKRFNREGPGIIREAMIESLKGDPLLSAYGDARFINADTFPGEKREMGTPKAGSGVNIKFTNNKFTIRIQLLSRRSLSLFGRDGWYTFKYITEGRQPYSFVPRSPAGVYAIRVNESTTDKKTYAATTPGTRYKNKVEPRRKSNRIVFRRAINGVVQIHGTPVRSNWPERAIEIATRNALRKFST